MSQVIRQTESGTGSDANDRPIVPHDCVREQGGGEGRWQRSLLSWRKSREAYGEDGRVGVIMMNFGFYGERGEVPL